MALGNMVGSLTVGKKKYADVEADIIALNEKADALEKRLLELVAKDAEVFEPLSKAYGLPKDTPATAHTRRGHGEGPTMRAAPPHGHHAGVLPGHRSARA